MRMNTPGWLIPAGLIALSLVPVLSAGPRLIEVAGAPVVTPDNARYLVWPPAIFLHAIGGALFLILGALQFAPGRRGRWHRVAGRIVVAAGLVAALSGIWMTLTFPAEPANGPLIYAARLLTGPAWALCLILGLRAAMGRRITAHHIWMRRAMALGLGGGTTVLILGPWVLATGSFTPTASALAQIAAWAINLTVAEYFNHAPRRHVQKGAAA
ncbi:MAG: DUF2306 domain-containing protein [Rhodobacterales bacterium]|nr:DUF2306 domain-containing protein [Rhodobacterales bacterium]